VSESILIVDDEKDTLELLDRFFSVEGYDVVGVLSGAEALEAARGQEFDLLITDLNMPEMDGISLLREMRSVSPKTVGIVITGFASVDTAVEAMKIGARDYVSKPFKLDEIRLVVSRTLEHRRLQNENLTLKKQLKKKYRFENLIGDHQNMQNLFRLIERVANSNSTVLITGESGTGKELVARAIHYNSDRRDKYLIPINCGAIPEPLLESEIFGYVKGAFTGATTNRVGRFEAASGGTIFLDEVGEMSPALQVKILRVIQEQEFQPVGSSKTKKIDVRVISASNTNLEEAIEQKKFRRDLYYRLNVIPLEISPLRERRSDIPLVINHFLDRFRREKGRNIKPFDDDVSNALMAYDWRGNVRELENLIERMIILSEDDHVSLNDLPPQIHQKAGVVLPGTILIPDEGLEFNNIVGEFENRLIRSALEKSRGNKNMAAKLLGLKRTTLVEKIKKKGLENQVE